MTYGYACYGYGGVRPAPLPPATLDLNFLTSEVLDPRVTVSGGTNGTRVNSAGLIVLQSAPRYDYDPAKLAAAGIWLEGAHTNVALRNAEFDNADWTLFGATVSANMLTSPAGTLTGDKVVEDGSNGAHVIRQTAMAVANGSLATFSVYAHAAERSKLNINMDIGSGANWAGGAFDLVAMTTQAVTGVAAVARITDAGGGWRRCSLTGTTQSATSRATVFLLDDTFSSSYPGIVGNGLYLWGGQMQAGPVSSLLMTLDTPITRVADTLVLTGSNFSSWYNPAQGTFIAEGDSSFGGGQRNLMVADDGTLNNQIVLLCNAAPGNAAFAVNVAGAAQAALSLPGVAPFVPFKIGGAYQVNNFGASLNGGAPIPDNLGTLPAVNVLRLGFDSAGTGGLSGHLRRLRYYPTRLSDAQLARVTE